MTKAIFAVVALLLLAVSAWGEETEEQKLFLDSIQNVESGGRDNPPDGDDGKAIGPDQIWKPYFTDAIASDRSLRDLKYEDCRDPAKARLVVIAYMKRYAPAAWKNGDWKTCARIHNGGPKGAQKKTTMAYWQKVQNAMIKIAERKEEAARP